MDAHLFVQQLLDLSEEDGRTYILQYAAELSDAGAVGLHLREEVLRQRDIQPFTSLKLAELLIFFGEHLHHFSAQAIGLHAKGIALSSIGLEEAAIAYMDVAGELFLRMGDEINWARTRIGRIASCAWLGRIEEALQEAVRARAVFERHGELYWVCVVDHNTAVIYTQTGQYQRALELYERMLVIYPTLIERGEDFIQRAIAMVEFNQSRNLAWLGDFAQARQLLQSALARFSALGQTLSIIRVEDSLAMLDYVQGYYGSALRRYYQILDNMVEHKLHKTLTFALILLRIAMCLLKLNRTQEACQLASEAVDVCRELGVSLDRADALREYAATLIASHRLKDAIEVLDEAYALFSQGGLLHNATIIRQQQAELLLEMHFFVSAYEQASLLKQYADAQGLVARSADACLIMAGALVRRAQEMRRQAEDEESVQALQEATALCEQVITLAGEHNLQEQLYKSRYLLGQLALIQHDSMAAENHYSAAIEQIEQMLDDLVLDLLPAFLHTTWGVYEGMIALCLQQAEAGRAFNYLERARSMALRHYLKTVGQPEREMEMQQEMPSASQAKNAAVLRLQSQLSEWQSRYHAYSARLAALDRATAPEVDPAVLKSELQRCEAKISELFERLHLGRIEEVPSPAQMRPVRQESEQEAIKGLDIAQLRQRLAPDQLLLAYFLYQGRLVIFAVTQDDLLTYENPDGMALLERLLPPLYAHLDPRGWADVRKPTQLAIRRVLQKLYQLLIAPISALLPHAGGALTIVPYGPLHNLAFHALHTGSRFLIEDFQINYLPASNLLSHLSTPRSFAASGSPLIFGYSGNGELQRALEEAISLAFLLGGRRYLEQEATIARLVEASAGSPIIHLATHGQVRLDAPNFSYVRLADGQLNAIDAFSLKLDGCELVTLSGCETGLALSGGGDEQLGLGRAFLAAGASSLVMSLWPVEDTATNELMQRFYQQLLQGDSKVEALRAAQRSLLAQSSSPYTHPYFWAAFRLVGDVGPLQYTRTA